VKAHHDVHKDQAGKDRTVIFRFEKVQNSSPAPKGKVSQKPDEAGW